MNNEKLRSTEQKFWLVKSKRDIKAVLSKMSLEQRKDDYNNRNSTKQIKKKQRGYGSDRINRASRETLSICSSVFIRRRWIKKIMAKSHPRSLIAARCITSKK